jgi:hypothetical protein
MPAKPTTVAAYLAALPPDRREAVEAICKVIDENVDQKFEHGMQYGMPAWYLPHAVYPPGYHCDPKQPLPFASVASQKRHIGIYLFCVYNDPDEKERFVMEWNASGHRLDMGAGCVRVRSLDETPLDVIGRAVKRVKAQAFVTAYEAGLPESVKRKRAKAASSA